MMRRDRTRWRALGPGLALALILTAPALAEDEATPALTEPTVDDRKLVEALEQAIEAAQGTPAQEFVNRANLDGKREAIALLQSREPVPIEDLTAARDNLRRLLERVRLGPDWPTPPTFDVPRAASPPTIDGRVDEAVWSQAATFEGVYRFNEPEYHDEPATRWRIMWDDTYLYFAFECRDDDIIAPEIERNGPIWQYDCVEMFILPSFRHGVYWEIIISPSGSVYDGLNAKRFDQWGKRSRSEENLEGLRYGVHIFDESEADHPYAPGYSVEVAVPFDELPEYSRAEPAVGQTLGLMLVRLDLQSGEPLAPYAFVPLLGWGHNIWNHTTIRLADAPEASDDAPSER